MPYLGLCDGLSSLTAMLEQLSHFVVGVERAVVHCKALLQVDLGVVELTAFSINAGEVISPLVVVWLKYNCLLKMLYRIGVVVEHVLGVAQIIQGWHVCAVN